MKECAFVPIGAKAALTIAVTLSLFVLPTIFSPSIGAFADTSKTFPPVNLIDATTGNYVTMTPLEYKASSGIIVTRDAFKPNPPDGSSWWTDQPLSSVVLKMEKNFKLRVAEDTSIYKTIAKTRTDHGIAQRLEYGDNDDWDHFQRLVSIYDGATNYKITYNLNQHNLSCPNASDEDFTMRAGVKYYPVQVYAQVYFTDGTWQLYGVNVSIIGANAYDNPC